MYPDLLVLNMRRLLLSVALLSTALLPAAAPAASPTGKWRGAWSSQSTGHTGALRARIRQTGPDTYRAIFAGRFAMVVPFIYSAKLERVPGTCDCYRSRQRLPIAGTYQMTAHVSPHRFYARFQSKKDVGTFDMSR
jgi:hypothetical protein